MSCANESNSGCCGVRGSHLLAALGALLIVALIVWAMRHYTTPPSLTAARAAERQKHLADLRVAEAPAFHTYGWVDPAKGVVRLSIERAMELTVAAGGDPAGFRKDLIERVEKATFVPPPPPEQPSVFE